MMSPDAIFSVCNSLVLPGWLLLLAAPRWRWTQRVAALMLPALLACVYGWLAIGHWGGGGDFASLSGVRTLFANPWVLLAGWIHYLAFDLFIGAWESRDALRHRVPRALVWPCLLLTFLFGPLGLLSYLLIRASVRRRIEVD